MTHRSSDRATNRTIVRAFLQVAGIPIEEHAIHDADEPSPDILCTFTNGTRVAFELTEAVDEGVARNVSVSDASRAQMREYYQKLALVERTKLQGIFGNAHISVHTKHGIGDKKFMQMLPRVFHLLRGCSGDTQGDLKRDTLPSGVEAIQITRGRWSCGPLLDRGGLALYVADPTLRRMEAKFSKRYKCDCPIELLVHSRTCPLAPDNLWKNDVHDFVTRKIAGSPFSGVSVFDWIDSTIRYTYPAR